MQTHNSPAAIFHSEKELASRLGLARITLRKWRLAGRGPAFARFGTAIRYAAADIEAWLVASKAKMAA